MDFNSLFTLLISQTSNWSIQIAFIMITCNLISITIGRYAIQTRSSKPSIPITVLDGLGLPELLATASLGHIIGAGIILGLRSIGGII